MYMTDQDLSDAATSLGMSERELKTALDFSAKLGLAKAALQEARSMLITLHGSDPRKDHLNGDKILSAVLDHIDVGLAQ